MNITPSRRMAGFTFVELMVVIVVIGILAGIVSLGFGLWQRDLAEKSVQHDLFTASVGLETYRNTNNYYPSNLADTGFAASDAVAVKFMTNASQTPTYPNLSGDQNAQLLLNSCNAFMPITSGATVYNTSCSFAGINVHVAGQGSSNIVLHGPTITKSSFVLTCGASCSAAQTSIISIFEQQGGTWPITVPKKQVPLPAPTYIPVENSATKYCLEGRSTNYSDVLYHILPTEKSPVAGSCPNDTELHYP